MIQLKVLMITTGKGLKCGGGDQLTINKYCQTLQIEDRGDFFSSPALMHVRAQQYVRSGSDPMESRVNPEWQEDSCGGYPV